MNDSPRHALTVVGSINLDITATGARLPSPGETIGDAVLRHQPGGKGANQAVAAARLAGGSRMIGAVGDDDSGRALLQALGDAGVDTGDVASVDAPTGTALVLVDSHGENQIVVCPGANQEVSLQGVDFAADEAILCQLEVGLAVVLEAARRAPGYFALNAAPAMSLPTELLDRCDLVIVNETEYAMIPELAHARLVAVTYGKNGSAIYERGQQLASAAALPVPVANTVGAGDAFCAALVLALRQGLAYEHALAVASAVGADAVGDPSSQPAFAPLASYVEATRAESQAPVRAGRS
ncbi:ribokinase [Saxibacter everestensis]|uniref:Ribokinase n=1 Tax=Saxibacter everestensis TaxID=2909229 RepID=A0ABY8QRP9_9MICO|nr:ribokinase [Brevibacteriaceae bacterium ZFBP1038]